MSQYELNRSRLPDNVCEHLCTKTMFYGENRRQGDDLPDSPFKTAAFWCVFTQRPWGPDEELVGPDECTPGRACCKPRLAPAT